MLRFRRRRHEAPVVIPLNGPLASIARAVDRSRPRIQPVGQVHGGYGFDTRDLLDGAFHSAPVGDTSAVLPHVCPACGGPHA